MKEPIVEVPERGSPRHDQAVDEYFDGIHWGNRDPRDVRLRRPRADDMDKQCTRQGGSARRCPAKRRSYERTELLQAQDSQGYYDEEDPGESAA